MTDNQAIKTTEGQAIEGPTDRPAVAPAVDIHENEDEILLVADMPGVAPKDLSVRYDGGQLHLEGATVPRHGQPAYISREFAGRDYRRVFQLAPIIDANKVKAEIRDGVLTVRLPKSAAAKPRQIKVKRG